MNGRRLRYSLVLTQRLCTGYPTSTCGLLHGFKVISSADSSSKWVNTKVGSAFPTTQSYYSSRDGNNWEPIVSMLHTKDTTYVTVNNRGNLGYYVEIERAMWSGLVIGDKLLQYQEAYSQNYVCEIVSPGSLFTVDFDRLQLESDE